MNSRSRFSAPLPPRERSLSSAQPPSLTLRPVEFSLTDGTNIPPPAKETTPPHSPARSPSPGPGSGPLSSHPVTPIDGVDMYAFPSLQTTTSTHINGNGNGDDDGEPFTFPPRSYTDTPSTSTLDNRDSSFSQHSQPQSQQSQQYQQYQQYQQFQQYQPHDYSQNYPPNTYETQRSRRPSIAQRFLSSLRSRSSSLRGNTQSRPPSRSSAMILNSGAGPFELDGTANATPQQSPNGQRHIPRRSSRLSLTLARLTSSHPTPTPVPAVTAIDSTTSTTHRPGANNTINNNGTSAANTGITPRELALGDSPIPSRPATGRTSMTLSGTSDLKHDNRGVRKRSMDWFTSLPLGGGGGGGGGNTTSDDRRRRAQSATWGTSTGTRDATMPSDGREPSFSYDNNGASYTTPSQAQTQGRGQGQGEGQEHMQDLRQSQSQSYGHAHSASTPNALTRQLSPSATSAAPPGRFPARRPVPPPSHLRQYPQQYQQAYMSQQQQAFVRQGPPPPQLPGVRIDVPELDGETLFKDIGRRGTVYHGKKSHRSFQFA